MNDINNYNNNEIISKVTPESPEIFNNHNNSYSSNENENNNIPIDTNIRDDIFVKKFGIKSIGTIGGICLLIGNCTGPGMVNISYQFQQGGFLLSIFGYVLMLILSGLSALFIIESMSLIPGNSKFQLRIEFTMICRFYFGKWMYIVSQLFINTSLIITNIASIIICSQIADSLIIFLFKKTCGISFENGWICVSKTIENVGESSPFSNQYMFITIGYIAIIIIVLPLGFLNLNDNIYIQIVCVIIMLVIVTLWLVIFIFIIELDGNNLPVIGKSMNGISQIIGNCMFNYSFITTIPSWVNESKPNVNLKKSIWTSISFSTVLFLSIGIFGALSFQYPIASSSNILSLINSNNYSKFSNVISKISIYLFPFVVLASTIPVFSIIVRYNLTQNKFLPNWLANFISIVLPWLGVIPFQTGNWLNIISNYSSLFFTSFANFIIPFLLYLKSLQFKNQLKFENNINQLNNIENIDGLKLEQSNNNVGNIIDSTDNSSFGNISTSNSSSSSINQNISNSSTSSLNSLFSIDQQNILKELLFETVDHEENTFIEGRNFKSLSGIPRNYSKIIALFCLILLLILIVLVIFSNFYFTN